MADVSDLLFEALRRAATYQDLFKRALAECHRLHCRNVRLEQQNQRLRAEMTERVDGKGIAA